MKQKNLSSINIKNKLWIWLLAESILLSACGSETRNQKPEEKTTIQKEEKTKENPRVIKEETVDTEYEGKNSSGYFSTYQRGEFDEYGDQYSLIEAEDGEFAVTQSCFQRVI